MKNTFSLRVLVALISANILLTSCDRVATQGRTDIVIQMPSVQELRKMTKSDVSGFAALEYDKICFAVNVKGPGIVATPAKTCNIERGQFAGTVGAGGTLTVTVDSGENREFELYAYIRNSVSEVCPKPSEGKWAWSLNKIYFLGKVEGVKIVPPETLVEIPFTLPDASQNIIVQNSWPLSCLSEQTPSVSRIGRVVVGGTILGTAGSYRAYSKVSTVSDQNTLGTTYKIRNWKVGQQ